MPAGMGHALRRLQSQISDAAQFESGLLRHFANGSTLRGRIYPYIPTNAPFGLFHLAIGNAMSSTELPVRSHHKHQLHADNPLRD